MSATHYRRAFDLLEGVAAALERGSGTKKSERAEMLRHLNGAKTSLVSSAYHEERPTLGDLPDDRRPTSDPVRHIRGGSNA